MRHRFLMVIFLVTVLGLSFWPTTQGKVFAQTPDGGEEDGPNRTTSLTISVTKYEWLLSDVETGGYLCTVVSESEGLPTSLEILESCGEEVHEEWKATQPCEDPEAESGDDVCSGVYLFLANTWNEQRDISVDLSPAAAWVNISGCDLHTTDNICTEVPNLLITGEEPLPNESIISIQGVMDGEPFSCGGAECEVPLPSTGMQGVEVEFWAESSFGDASPHYTALVRVIPWGNFADPEGSSQDDPLWYVDVISTQWQGTPLAYCSQSWESFPGLGSRPGWLVTPEDPAELVSSDPYYYLAGYLIQNGQVDAQDCPEGGLEAEGVANVCGLERAQPAVTEWQNSFDAKIIDVARDSGVPAQLMKNIFARESQFWPGIFRTFKEVGLGQLTENGADTVLLWNPTFYSQFCPLVLDEGVCQDGFAQLGEYEQNLLKGALVKKVNASCPDCPAGIDLDQASFSINVFANTLWANCEQAGQIVYNTTGAAAGLASSYVDLWRFTLVNYNAGAGCLSEAVQQTYDSAQELTWENVSANLDEACQPAVDYVNDVTATRGDNAEEEASLADGQAESIMSQDGAVPDPALEEPAQDDDAASEPAETTPEDTAAVETVDSVETVTAADEVFPRFPLIYPIAHIK